MQQIKVKVYPSTQTPTKENQLAWKIAETASDHSHIDDDAAEMVINRIIDNASVAIAASQRTPVQNARLQALSHPRDKGATVFGLPASQKFSAEWACWANGTAVRELDYHDTFLAADYSHPADNIPALFAVAQQCGKSGQELLRGILTGYEIQMALVKGICLHKHKIDHIAHLGPSVAAGLGTMLKLDTDTIYQSVQQATHVSVTTRQSRKGEISSWKAYAPAHAGKLGIEAVDRCMRGEKSPCPVYEGEDSIIAWVLDGPEAEYNIELPDIGQPKKAILDSYTKEHSAEYQSQALIDLAVEMRNEINDFDQIKDITIYTSHHTHYVIGTGAGDPQKMDPQASRETLDHSIMYIFAVALEDGSWHHEKSYTRERANKEETVKLWHKISTQEEEKWTKQYHHPDPYKRAFGGRVVIRFNDGRILEKEKSVANAHPAGDKPFERKDYIRKFNILTEPFISESKRNQFIETIQDLKNLSANDIFNIGLEVDLQTLQGSQADNRGIF